MSISPEQILLFRKSLDLSQEKFGLALGYSRSYVKDIESGRSVASRGFIEAINKEFGVSFDNLFTHNVGRRAYRAVKGLGFENSFAFIYGFTEEEIEAAEIEIMEFLSEKPHVVVDAKGIKTFTNFLSAIIGEKSKANEIYDNYGRFCADKDQIFILVKNFSKSGISNKGIALREFVKIHEFAAVPLEHVVIVLDRPSFLEKYYESLYCYATAFHFSKSYL